MQMFAGRAFQTEGIVSGKALEQEHTQDVHRTMSRSRGSKGKVVGEEVRKMVESQIW